MAIGALDELAYCFAELELSLTLYLDGLVGSLDCLEHLSLLDLLHLTLDHHDVVQGSTDHQLDVGTLQLLEGGVDDELAIDARYAYLTDGAIEGNVGYSQCSRGSEPSQCIRHIYPVGREEDDVDEDLCMVVIWEEGT